jgi:hypothetical protein
MCRNYEALCSKFSEGFFINLDFEGGSIDSQLRYAEAALSLYNSDSDPFIFESIDFD